MARVQVLGEPEGEGNSTTLRREGENLETTLNLGPEGFMQFGQDEAYREGFSSGRAKA